MDIHPWVITGVSAGRVFFVTSRASNPGLLELYTQAHDVLQPERASMSVEFSLTLSLDLAPLLVVAVAWYLPSSRNAKALLQRTIERRKALRSSVSQQDKSKASAPKR